MTAVPAKPVAARADPAIARGVAMALLAVALFGATVVMQAALYRRGVTALGAVGLRYLIASAVCAAVLLAIRAAVLPVPGERGRAFVLGALVYALQAVLFYLALGHGTAGAVSMLFFTYPVMVLGIVLARTRRPPTVRMGAAALASFAGAALLVAAGSSIVLDGTGVVLALASSACAAGFLVANNTLLPRSTALAAAATVSIGVAASTLVLVPFTGGLGIVDTGSWALLLAAGAATGLATAAMYTALATLGAPRTSSILVGQTGVAVLGSWWLLDDPVVLGQLLGGAFIVGAVILAARSDGAAHDRSENRPDVPTGV